jgi:gluconokinase
LILSSQPSIIVLLGVSGSGKSTVGALLARTLGFEFYDADDLHPEENKRRMASGVPLTDADRAPWLQTLQDLIASLTSRGHNAVVAFSGLKQAYRDRIAQPGVRFVYLKGSSGLLAARLAKRTGHFFDPKLLGSQLETFEEPVDALTINVSGTPMEIVGEIVRRLGLGKI